MRVCHDLELNMVRIEHELLEVTISIPEYRVRLVTGRPELIQKLLFVSSSTHPLAPATRCRLDHDRKSDLTGRLQRLLFTLHYPVGSGGNRHPVLRGGGTSSILIAHRTDQVR